MASKRTASWELNSKLAANLVIWGREKWAGRIVYRDGWGRFRRRFNAKVPKR